MIHLRELILIELVMNQEMNDDVIDMTIHWQCDDVQLVQIANDYDQRDDQEYFYSMIAHLSLHALFYFACMFPFAWR